MASVTKKPLMTQRRIKSHSRTAQATTQLCSFVSRKSVRKYCPPETKTILMKDEFNKISIKLCLSIMVNVNCAFRNQQCLPVLSLQSSHSAMTAAWSCALKRKQTVRSKENQKVHKCGQIVHKKRRTPTPKKKNICEFCGKSWARPSELLVRMKTHTGEKPYSCETCGKSFSTRRIVTVHMRTHTEERPYTCEICGKGFKQQYTRSTHMRTHTGEKPYSCSTCGRGFSLQGNLVVHMRTHTGEKPYSCETCGKRFPRCSSLLNHITIHTGERPYCCEIWGKTFSLKSLMSSHQKTHKKMKS
uniref:C2H2-type domain-containing protein n=1 Tax=Salarias fasciatus TaxID=181472 RepID=A0A672J1B3_SALFA